jgi:hypothetical protein
MALLMTQFIEFTLTLNQSQLTGVDAARSSGRQQLTRMRDASFVFPTYVTPMDPYVYLVPVALLIRIGKSTVSEGRGIVGMGIGWGLYNSWHGQPKSQVDSEMQNHQ